MTSRVVSYGGAELKRLMYRYWMYGLAFSVVIHLVVLATQFLVRQADAKTSGTTLWDPDRKTVGITLNPATPCLPSMGPRTATANPVRNVEGTPTPIKIDAAVPGRTMPTNVEDRDAVQPGTNGSGPVGDTSIEPPLEDPPPFQPVSKEAVVVKSVRPEYPELALRAGLEGRVAVKVLVDKEGRVRKASVLKSSDPIFEEVALEAARQFVFAPACMTTGPVAVWVSVPFVFRLAGR